jgi:hypothetical protein
MPYKTGTVVGSSTGPADVRTQIETLMTAQGNWTLVDTYTTGTMHVRMWQCMASGNSWGTAWYLAMMTNTASPTYLYFKVFEDYISATKLCVRGVPNSSTTVDLPTASGYGNTGYAVDHGNWASYQLEFPSSTFIYRIRVTASGVYGYSSLGNYYVYGGLFLPIWTHANEFPLLGVFLGNSGTPGCTRRPGIAGSSSSIWYMAITVDDASRFDGAFGTLGRADGMAGSRVYASRQAVRHYSTVNGVSETIRGCLDTDLLLVRTDATVAIGDTLNINSVPYVCIGDNGTMCCFLRTD